MSNDDVPAVFVTGATGDVGSAVVRHLQAKGQRVVGAVRPGSSARLPDGVEAREFAFGPDVAAHRAALAGYDRLFLLRPPAIEDVQGQLFPVIDAALDTGIRQIV
ncbi:NAD-dependent epimerase/dehydratase family protein [Microbacterium lacticum]